MFSYIAGLWPSWASENPFSSDHFRVERSSATFTDEALDPRVSSLSERSPAARATSASPVSKSLTHEAHTLVASHEANPHHGRIGCFSIMLVRRAFSIIFLATLNATLSVMVGIFVVPRIECSRLPSPWSSFCPNQNVPPSIPTSHLQIHDPITASTPPDPIRESDYLDTFIPGHENLALSSNGARIIADFSRLTPAASTHTWLSSLWDTLPVAFDVTTANQVLGRVVSPEHCWVFPGSQAELGIRLSKCKAVSYISMERDIGNVGGTRNAPKDCVVWGMVDGAESLRRVDEASDIYRLLASKVARFGSHQPSRDRHTFLPLAAFTYDASRGGLQQFQVFSEVVDLHMDFGVIVLQVLSNWGGPNTELCSVGVFAQTE